MVAPGEILEKSGRLVVVVGVLDEVDAGRGDLRWSCLVPRREEIDWVCQHGTIDSSGIDSPVVNDEDFVGTKTLEAMFQVFVDAGDVRRMIGNRENVGGSKKVREASAV